MLTKNNVSAPHDICKFRVALVLTFVFSDLVKKSSSIPNNKHIDRLIRARHFTLVVTGKKGFKRQIIFLAHSLWM